MNIHLDITTNSTVYNPLSAKGHWIHHRFGERKLNMELPLEAIKKVISNDAVTSVTFESVYGDPLDYTHFDQLIDYLQTVQKGCSFVTYGMNTDAIKLIKENNFFMYIKVCDKVFLNQDIVSVFNNISGYKNCMIENTIFKHNNNDSIKNECSQLEVPYVSTPGFNISGFCTSIIDADGNWLYDVHTVDSNETITLEKTSNAWHRLKMFVKPKEGVSILDKPSIKETKDDYLEQISQDDNWYITVSGHCIKNRERATVFSSALCSDWIAGDLSLTEPYEYKLLGILGEFSNSNLDSYNVLDIAISDILLQ